MTCANCKSDYGMVTFTDNFGTPKLGEPIVCRRCCAIQTVDTSALPVAMTDEQARLFASDRQLVERVARTIIALNLQMMRRHRVN